REDAGQRIRIDVRELLRSAPLEEGQCSFLVGRGCVYTQSGADMIGDHASVASIRQWRTKRPHLKIGLRLEQANFPGAGGVDCRASESEEVLAVRIGTGLVAIAQISGPACERAERSHPGFVRQLL